MKTITRDGQTLVLLTRPGFEWGEMWGDHEYVRLYPIRPDDVVDTITEKTVKHLGQGFIARAEPYTDIFWRVTTQAGHPGGRRHRLVRTRGEAMEILHRWYWRRFRFADVIS